MMLRERASLAVLLGLAIVSSVFASPLDRPSQIELAEADSLELILTDPIGSCDAVGRMRQAARQLEIRRKHLGEQHPDVGASLQTLAKWIREHGELRQADSLYQLALANQHAALGPDHPRVAEVLYAIATNLATDRHATAAESLYHEIVRIHERAYGPGDHPARANDLMLAALIEEARHDYERAEEYLNQSLLMRRRLFEDDHEDVVESIAALAGVRLLLGDFDGAELLNRRALDFQRQSFASAPCRLIPTLYNMAHILREQGEPNEAVLFLQELTQIARAENRPPETLIDPLNLLGLIHMDLEEYEKAVEVLREVAVMDELRSGPRVPTVFRANLGATLIRAHHLPEADSVLARLRSDLEAAPEPKDQRLVAQVAEYQSRSLDWSGRFDAAEEKLLQALEWNLKTAGEAQGRVVTIYERLAQSRVGPANFVAAEAYLTSAARAFELARAKAGGGTKRATFTRTPYEYRALTRLELGRDAEAWQDVELSRSRILSESAIGDSTPFSLDRVQRALSPHTAIVGWIDLQLRYGDPLTPRSWAYVIRDAGPVAWERLPRPDTETVKVLASRFRSFRDGIADAHDSALGLRNEDAPWAVTRALWDERVGPVTQHLAGVEDLIVIPSGPMAGLPLEVLTSPTGALLGDLYTVSYAPSATMYAWLAEQRTPEPPNSVVVFADPPLNEAQLASAATGSNELVTRDGAEASVLRDAVKGDRASLSRLPRLRWSRREAAAVARVFREPTILIGENASEQSLERLLTAGTLARFDVVHFATHALVDNIKPARSAVVLSQIGLPDDAGDRSRETPDGKVTASEIEDRWKLRARLVTLSACETALGRDVFGEGIVGFTQPLIQAGARSVLASLWKVDDEATALLMERFYENWLGSYEGTRSGKLARTMTEAEALRDAKCWLRTFAGDDGERRFEHPYYWSPFVLVGAGG